MDNGIFEQEPAKKITAGEILGKDPSDKRDLRVRGIPVPPSFDPSKDLKAIKTKEQAEKVGLVPPKHTELFQEGLSPYGKKVALNEIRAAEKAKEAIPKTTPPEVPPEIPLAK